MESSQFQLLDGSVHVGGQELPGVPGSVPEERAGRPRQAQERTDVALADGLDAFQHLAPGMGRVPHKGWLRARQLDHIVTNLERLQIVKRSRVQTRIRSGDGGSGRESTTNANA